MYHYAYIMSNCVGVEFELSEDDYQQSEEPDALMEVRIAKTRGRLANPIRFRVIPLTVIEAESMGIANYTRPADDDVSPSIAGRALLSFLYDTSTSLFNR